MAVRGRGAPARTPRPHRGPAARAGVSGLRRLRCPGAPAGAAQLGRARPRHRPRLPRPQGCRWRQSCSPRRTALRRRGHGAERAHEKAKGGYGVVTGAYRCERCAKVSHTPPTRISAQNERRSCQPAYSICQLFRKLAFWIVWVAMLVTTFPSLLLLQVCRQFQGSGMP